MDHEIKIEVDGYRYTFKTGVSGECCCNCILHGVDSCRISKDFRKLDRDFGAKHYCIEKEKIDDKIVYKPGMEVVIIDGADKAIMDKKRFWSYENWARKEFIPGRVLTLKDQNSTTNGSWNVEEISNMAFPSCLFKPYTEKENKEMETKYKLVKDLTGKAIAESACSCEFEKFVKRCGYHTKVVWDLELEKYAIERGGWISFLVNEGFLVERVNNLVFNEESVFTTMMANDVYKIYRITTGNEFSMIFIGRKNNKSSSNQISGLDTMVFDSFNSIVKRLDSEGWETK